MEQFRRTKWAAFVIIAVHLSWLTPKVGAQAVKYRVVHRVVVDEHTEFISVILDGGVSDANLTTAATELHKSHPSSDLTFYEQVDIVKIKRYWTCFLQIVHQVFDDPR